MAQLKLMKKEWFNWFDKTFLDNITAWTEYYYINPDTQHWISNNLIDLSTFYTDSSVTIDAYGNVTMNPATNVQVAQFRCVKKKDDVITISFDAYSDIDGSVLMADVYPDSASPFGDLRAVLTTTKQHFIKTWTLEDNSTNIRFFRVLSHAHATESKIFVSNISVVVGSNEPVVYNPRLIKIEDILEVLDLGSVDWSTPSANGWCQTSNRVSARPITSLSAMPYLFCAKYKVGSANFVFTNNETIGLDNSPKIVIRSTEFIGKTGIQVKQMLSGVYVIFLKNDAPY